MTWRYAVQFAAPLILIGWLLRLPARNGPGFVVQAVPATWGTWTVVVLFMVLGTISTYGAVIALRSRTNTATDVVNLAFPLEPGT